MKRKFFIRNFFMIAMPAVLVVSLLGCMSVWMTFDNARKSIQKDEAQAVNRIKSSMEVIFSEADAQSLNYSISPHIMVKLKSLLDNGYMGKEQMDVSYMLKPFLDSNVNSKPFLHSVYIYLNNENGNFFASGVGLANELNYSDVEWIGQAENGVDQKEVWFEDRTISAYLKSSYSVDVLTLYKRIYGSVYTRPIGAIVLNIRKDYLEEMMAGYLVYEGQSIVVTAEDGTVLCRAGAEFPAQECYVASEESSGYGLSYISYVPRAAANQKSQSMMQMVGFFIGMSLLLSMLLAYMVTKRNARNVERVTLLFELAERGEQLPEITGKANDEYSYIIENVVRNYVEKSALQMQLTEKRYELDRMYFSFLQSQLGPHFLFNTLKTIFWKTIGMTGGPNDTSRMIDRLTNLLYYALVRPEKYVKVAEEIKMTGSYLEVQQMRFEYKFHTVWEFDKTVEQCETMRFVLQPLVDNSITHGFEEGNEEGEIRISIWSDEALHFKVTDNGKGFSVERLASVRELLQGTTPPSHRKSLYNLNRRLVLTYGDDAGLQIESTPGVETSVSFSIPISVAELNV